MENENQESTLTENPEMDKANPETSTEGKKNSFEDNVRELRLSKERYQREAEMNKRELERIKSELSRKQSSPNSNPDEVYELKKELSDIKTAIALHVNCPGYVNVVTPENEEKYAKKYPSHYAALSEHPNKTLVGASLYEGILEMQKGSSKNDLEQKVKDNKQSISLSPENQVSSFAEAESGMINDERIRQARLLEERIMSGKL